MIRKDGTVTCWGRNAFGQAGLGSASKTPVAPGKSVKGLQGVRSLAAGIQHVCALTEAGGVACWGANYAGQLGSGAPLPSDADAAGPAPVFSATPVVGLPGKAIAIDAGITHTCAVLANGSVMCWGSNDHGELGTPAGRGSSVPVLVPEVSDALEVAAGVEHNCARRADNSVVCWGEQAKDAASTTCATQLTAGHGFTCALECGSGSAVCWGTTPHRSSGSPAPIPGSFAKLNEIRAGYWHICLNDSSNKLHCWGGNDSGQLGVGMGKDWSDDWHDEPTVVTQPWKETRAVCAGGVLTRPFGKYRRAATFLDSGATCALSSSDEVFCWGEPNLDFTPKKILDR